MTENIKCVVHGQGTVGKTCMLISYANNSFPDDYVPTIFDNYNATVLWENKHVSLGLWDNCYQEDWERWAPLSFPETDIFMLCVSVIDRDSLEWARNRMLPIIREHAIPDPGVFPGDRPKLMVVGTKIDLRDDEHVLRALRERDETPLTRQELERFAREIRADAFMENSALTQRGLADTFHEAIRLVLQPYDRNDGPLTFEKYVVGFGKGIEEKCCTVM